MTTIILMENKTLLFVGQLNKFVDVIYNQLDSLGETKEAGAIGFTSSDWVSIRYKILIAILPRLKKVKSNDDTIKSRLMKNKKKHKKVFLECLEDIESNQYYLIKAMVYYIIYNAFYHAYITNDFNVYKERLTKIKNKVIKKIRKFRNEK